MNTCKDCFYWDSKVEGGKPYEMRASVDPDDKRMVILGYCRRYAPHMHFPTTREDDWCGDFADKLITRKATKMADSWRNKR